MSIEEAVKALDGAEAAAAEGATKEGGDEEAKEEEAEPVEKVNVGREIVKDLMKAFQAFLDERKWKSVRYCVRYSSLLSPLRRC